MTNDTPPSLSFTHPAYPSDTDWPFVKTSFAAPRFYPLLPGNRVALCSLPAFENSFPPASPKQPNGHPYTRSSSPALPLPPHLLLSPPSFGRDLESMPFGQHLEAHDWLQNPDVSPVIHAGSQEHSQRIVATSSNADSPFLDKLNRHTPAPESKDRATQNSSSLLRSPIKTPSRRRSSNTVSFSTPMQSAPKGLWQSSPLTPLTPEPVSRYPSTRAFTKKRQLLDQDESRPLSKRLRSHGRFEETKPIPPLPSRATRSVKLSSSKQSATSRPQFTLRPRPKSQVIETASAFELFYRRFPASSYFQPADLSSPCSLFRVQHPGGAYNPPRSPLDLYTPRFVKGKGAEKVGLCPICIEPPRRGGEDKKLWLAMKFSAFKYYHMQCAHGISASTGQPFSPPVAFRTTRRPNAGKNERGEIKEGKCHKCTRWIPIEGVKDVPSKIKELYWWKHATSCHQGTSFISHDEVFELDNVYEQLQQFT